MPLEGTILIPRSPFGSKSVPSDPLQGTILVPHWGSERVVQDRVVDGVVRRAHGDRARPTAIPRPGDAVVGERERIVVRAGLDVTVGPGPGLFVFNQLLHVGGKMVGEFLDDGSAAGQHDLAIANDPAAGVECLGAVLADDLFVPVPGIGSSLSFDEVVEPDVT